MYRYLIGFCAGLLIFIFVISVAVSQVYPSAGTAWVLTGQQQAATAPHFQQRFHSASAVSQWEDKHADISIGGHYSQYNAKKITQLGYMYNQKLDWQMGQKEQQLRHWMTLNQQDYESLFLHFQNDTQFEIPNNNHGVHTPLYGTPEFVATQEASTLTRQGRIKPLSMPIQQPLVLKKNQTLYLFSSEKLIGLDIEFDGQQLESSNITISYATRDIATNTLEYAWQPLLTQPLASTLNSRWPSPLRWPRVSISSQLGSQLSAQLNVEHARFYALKIEINNPITGLTLTKLRLPSWYQFTEKSKKHYVTIPGWDPINDRNKDGYIDDSEYLQRLNNNASARLPYQARLIPLGRMWNEKSALCYVNLFSALNRTLLTDYLYQHWQQQGYRGAYNDSLYRVPNSTQFPTTTEGNILELQIPVRQAGKSYWQSLSAFNQHLQQTNPQAWIGANISDLNLFSQPDLQSLVAGFNFFVREDYINPSLGLSQQRGLLQRWEHFLLNAQGKRSVLMAHMRKGGKVRWQGHSQANWQHDQSTNLAIFYLLNNPRLDFYQQWNNSFYYSSKNTRADNYYQPGIPNNVAYQPTAMLRYNIGQPISAPDNYPPVDYVDKDNNIMATSLDTQLTVNNQTRSITPSHWFYFYRQANRLLPWQQPQPPTVAVIARRYQHGLILYYTDRNGGNKQFSEQARVTLDLPGYYRRLNADGSLSERINKITLTGYQGIILIPEPSPS
ncbi:hypothetical protein HWV03_21980 [Moritella sp. 36]|uniref:hypothetical protein n=1 Tax=Moritella sp. 36 TaxID=2746233 RepID=UPI001BA5F4C5|nr:hypothetical protein [Moritella sp. 36]QUM91242.1 hypothetical protein HWV03_21980 [Moritella sp. 36]